MTSEQFAYWLQGFVEINGGKQPTKEQWQIIQDHLKTIFHKVTPDYSSSQLGWAMPNDFSKTKVVC